MFVVDLFVGWCPLLVIRCLLIVVVRGLVFVVVVVFVVRYGCLLFVVC